MPWLKRWDMTAFEGHPNIKEGRIPTIAFVEAYVLGEQKKKALLALEERAQRARRADAVWFGPRK